MDDCSADPIVVPRLSHETFRPWSEDSSFPEAAAHGFEDGDVGVCQTQNLSRFSCDLGSRLGSGELPGSTGKHAGLFLNVPVSRNSSFSCVKLISYVALGEAVSLLLAPESQCCSMCDYSFS